MLKTDNNTRNHYDMKRIILLYLLFLISMQFIQAEDIHSKTDELLKYYVENFQFNGTVLIAHKGKPIYQKAFGYANRTWDIPNEIGTKYRIYSMSKAFTSMIIYQLLYENKIGLNDKLTKYLPDFKSDSANLITIRNLLTHTSGIKDYLKENGKTKEEIDRLSYSTREFIEKFIDNGLEFKPGSKVNYSNSNYYLLSVIIEHITGKTFEENIKDRIFLSLEMKNSGLDNGHDILKNMATGYFTDFGDYTHANYVNLKNLRGCGNIYSTADDLLKWDQALYTEKLLPDSLKQLMFTPLVGKMFASGWLTEKRIMKTHGDTLSLIRHSGGYYGFRSRIIRINDNEYTIIILSNTNMNNNIFMSIGDNLLNILYDEPFQYPKIPISLYLYPIIQNMGIEKASEEYFNVKKNKPDNYGFHFIELKLLGEKLVENKEYNEALGIFKINVKENPDNWVVYGDLADTYLKIGDKIHASENYAKCLEINKQKNDFERQAFLDIQKKINGLNE